MNKNRAFLSLFIVVLIVFIVLLFSYKDDSKNMNYVRFVDPSEKLKIESVFPITDYAGKLTEKSKDKKNIYYNFRIKNYSEKNSTYKLLLKVNKHDNSIDDKYVKILLSDDEDQILSKYDKDSYLTLDYLEKEDDYYVLYKSSLGENKEDSYTLRLWISDKYKEDDLNKVFDCEVVIYSY